jgi:hypothetical protein
MIAGFLALLLLIDWSLYFRHAGHFFQGDTVFLLDHRVHSVAGFLREFVVLHGSGWYRPLANEPIESILYPIFGLRPVPYHVPVYAVFILVTLMVYALAYRLTSRRLVAVIAAMFFNIHSSNAYTTYDVGFTPELFFALFYLVSVLAYWQYLQQGRKSALGISAGCFIASLLSKEAAVTLPGTLMVMHVLLGPPAGPAARRFAAAVRSTAVHTVLLVAYLIFVLGYLHVVGMTFAKLVAPPAPTDAAGYDLVFNKTTIVQNAVLGSSWAFNIPDGWWGRWRNLTPGMLAFLEGFRVLVLAGGLVLLMTTRRNLLLFGFAWFFITLLPALPLANHFLPYYTFVPIAGLSLIVGTVLAWVHDSLCRVHRFAALAFVVLMLAGTLYATNRAIRQEIQDNLLLGGSAQLALNSVNDMKRLYPALPPNANLYFDDTSDPLAWSQSVGGLLRMAYGVDLSVHYASAGDPLPAWERDKTIVIGIRNKHLFDETALYGLIPAQFIR